MTKVRGIRGATTADTNTRDDVLGVTKALLEKLIEANNIDLDDLAAAFFTTTPDLNAEFPAVAARELGLDRVPLLCTREIPVPGAMERVIRVLAQFYAPRDHRPGHAYLGAAQALRADLESAQ